MPLPRVVVREVPSANPCLTVGAVCMKSGGSGDAIQLQKRSIPFLMRMTSEDMRKHCRHISQSRFTLSRDVNHISLMSSSPLGMKADDSEGWGDGVVVGKEGAAASLELDRGNFFPV